jgi:hypothetical protein
VISQEVLLGETLLMDVKSLTYFGLDELGTRIWKEIESCVDANEVFRRLQSSSELSEEALARKFDGILKGLEISRIVTLEPVKSESSGI